MTAVLTVEGVTAGYGRITVLRTVDLAVPRGGVAALFGANGAGKTTLLRAIAGTIPLTAGRVMCDGVRLDSFAPHERARRGVVLVPEGRGVFPGLTVAENLRAAGPDTAAAPALDLFPRLRERLGQRADTLSGGEQQMLALARAMVMRPRVLLLDEVSRGLAPSVVVTLGQSLRALVDTGVSVLIVEQHGGYALDLADVCYVLDRGEVTFTGEPHELRDHAGV